MTVLTIGTFDCPHLGHANLFRRCRELGDRLVIGVNTDLFAVSYKGLPLFNEAERTALVAPFADQVLPNDGPGWDLIRLVSPDVLAVGSDWAPPADYAAQIGATSEDLAIWGITLAFVPRTEGISATEIKARLR